MYDPFFTTKEPGAGTGLGLAVVRGIVEQTGGRIWLYSEEGRGTAFKIFLPRYTTDRPVPAAEEEALPDRGTETILLVEDEDLLRSVVREAMGEHGFRVLEARNAAEALKVGREFGERIHLLVTDMIGETHHDRAARGGWRFKPGRIQRCHLTASLRAASFA